MKRTKSAVSGVNPTIAALMQQIIDLQQAGNVPVVETPAAIDTQGKGEVGVKITDNVYYGKMNGYTGVFILGRKKADGTRSWKFFGKGRLALIAENMDAIPKAVEVCFGKK